MYNCITITTVKVLSTLVSTNLEFRELYLLPSESCILEQYLQFPPPPSPWDPPLYSNFVEIKKVWCWNKHRHIEQNNRRKSTKTKPHVYVQLIFEKDSKDTQ
jgi:hypothetical protein